MSLPWRQFCLWPRELPCAMGTTEKEREGEEIKMFRQKHHVLLSQGKELQGVEPLVCPLGGAAPGLFQGEAGTREVVC